MRVISPHPLDDSPAQGPYLCYQARGRLSHEATLGRLSLGFTVDSVFSSGHTPGKSAALRRGAKFEPLSAP